MSALVVGGASASRMTATRSWGLSPGTAQITVPDSSDLIPGDEVVFAVGGLTFNGIVTNGPISTGDDGRTQTIEFADNRIKLMWDTVLCRFNNVEIIEDDPSTPGIDRKKRYSHIYPDDWHAQIKTYTAAPLTAKAILELVFAADDVRFAWSRVYHTAQDSPIHEIDASSGKKLGTLVQEITDAQGLFFTLDGAASLRWARKGEGALPSPAVASRPDWSEGESLNGLDTQVKIVGDRNRYQCFPVALEADWKAGWQSLVSEPAWLAAVDSRFGPFADTAEGHALKAAMARTVTVRQYANAVGSAELLDSRPWQDVARNEIPAWVYLRDVVFKVYRVPLSFTLNGIGLESIELVDGLMLGMSHSAGVLSVAAPDEFFPEQRAFVIAQGLQLDILDPRTLDGILPAVLSNANSEWSPNHKFTLDTKAKAVVFEHATFKSTNLFLFPNAGKTGVTSTHEIRNLCVPNEAATINPASVVACLVFEAERYSKVYGSGLRVGPHYVAGLNYHAVMQNGIWTREVAYADGGGADAKASAQAQALITRDSTYVSGGYRRVGAAGSALTGVIDRITITLDDNGLSETVDFTKERGSQGFVGERELERRERAKDLFPGQKVLSEEVRTLRALARVFANQRATPGAYASIPDVRTKPVGNVHAGHRIVQSEDEWIAGQPVLVDATGVVSSSGKNFVGVVIADGATGAMPLATQGVVPVRIKGPFATGDGIGIDVGAGKVPKVGGAVSIGSACAAYAGTEIVIAPVRLGSAPTLTHPWKIVDASTSDGAYVTLDGNYNLIFPEPTPSGLSLWWLPRIGGVRYNADPRPKLSIASDEVGIYMKIVLEDVAASTSELWGYKISAEPEIVAEPTSAPPEPGEFLAVLRIGVVKSSTAGGGRAVSSIENERFFPLGYRREGWWQHKFWAL